MYLYKLQWFNNSGKTKLTKSARISFFTSIYHGTAIFDVVPMQACSILLGRPWEFYNDALHHGRTNTYTFIKHAKVINNKPTIDTDKNNEIELQGGVLLASTSATAELCDNLDAPCYTMFCQLIMSCALPVVTNLLQVFVDGEESRTTSIIEGEDDEDIATLDMLTPSSFPSCNSSLPRHSRIQQTRRQCFDHNFFIRNKNGVILDLLERG